MKINAEWRLLLTGTPLQNNLQELLVSPNTFFVRAWDSPFGRSRL
jgi:SNF2 family DNA or RNA helicase